MTLITRNDRLKLTDVTLCAVTSVNVQATLRALEACLGQIEFAACNLLTDADIRLGHPEIRVIKIERLGSASAYSAFMLASLADHVDTSHCLIVQWDGHLLDARLWRPEFLAYDYIGASWPQFPNGHDVGNGGFSLRSRKLLEACGSPGFTISHPEDVAIGRLNRNWLEARGLLFAPRDLADRFAAERRGDPRGTFGYHGVFNMIRAIGSEPFWRVYRELDDRGSVWHDLGMICRDLAREPKGRRKAIQLVADRLKDRFGR